MKKNRQLKDSWVAKQFVDVFKSRPHWPAKEIMECIRRAYKVLVKRDFAYKVKYAAHRLLHGSMHDHYNKVESYVAALKACSLGTHLDLVTDVTKQPFPPVFQRLFCCFEGLQKGWKEGCRKVLCVDACFLKTFLGGELLSAVGRDGNDQMFPVAWAAVEGENNLSWEWFFDQLKSCLNLGEGEGIAIISDEHQAILNGVKNVFPKAEHMHCARHIFALWHKTYRGDEMKLQFWKIAKAFNLADYNDALAELEAINIDAATDFKGYNPSFFCRAYLDPTIRTNAITNNMAETFNGYIIQARTNHLIYMLEDIRAALMQRMVSKRQEIQKATSILCPRIQARLEDEKLKAANCDVIPSSDHLFNVNYYLDKLVVDLEAKTCTCRKWDMVGIPCCHAVACIYFQNKEVEEFVDDYYKRDSYLSAYAGSIPPLEGERHWPRIQSHLDPPPIKIGPGRPRRNRIKDPFENPKKPGSLNKVGVEMTCSLCLFKGHNKRRCPNRDTTIPREPAPKRPRNDGQQPHSKATSSSTTVISSAHPQNNTLSVQLQDTQPSQAHHSATSQPSQLGKGGRMIRVGKGSRGGSTSGGRGKVNANSTGKGKGVANTAGRGRGGLNGSKTGQGRGRGKGKNQVPVGVGIYIADDGSTLTNLPTKSGRPRGRPRLVNEQPIFASQPSQASTLCQPTQ
ncbi:uncharacterized protein [Spinacia oleracea]|uniref:SWIM-type domain-containing protein n=1 Tax=Spinacia oleracea TaxID=3562 RepID=A0ABM3QSH0_SPIOL|nr:uncharacterized protein LOC130462003 [Spinacia oleracea]